MKYKLALTFNTLYNNLIIKTLILIVFIIIFIVQVNVSAANHTLSINFEMISIADRDCLKIPNLSNELLIDNGINTNIDLKKVFSSVGLVTDSTSINNINGAKILKSSDINTIQQTNSTPVSLSSSNSVSVTITNLSGEVVYTTTILYNPINVSDLKVNTDQKLAKGIYFVTFVTNDQKITKKLVVE